METVIQEKILKALKEEMTHRTDCYDCLIAKFYLTFIGEKIYPSFNGRVPCFYRFCAILEYYFNIEQKEIEEIYLKYGKYYDVLYCEIFKARKDFWQEVYNLCLKRTNFNKI